MGFHLRLLQEKSLIKTIKRNSESGKRRIVTFVHLITLFSILEGCFGGPNTAIPHLRIYSLSLSSVLKSCMLTFNEFFSNSNTLVAEF